MTLKTDRLLLRPFGPEHLDDFYALHSDPAVTEFVLALDRDAALERLRLAETEWRQYGYGMLAVFGREDGRFLGRCGLKFWPEFGETEVGWIFRRDAWGRGYATEAARACVEWGFAGFELPYLTAMIDPRNSPSVRVAERLGMEPLREDELLGVAVVVYSLANQASTVEASRSGGKTG